jgi:hypothetical protein
MTVQLQQDTTKGGQTLAVHGIALDRREDGCAVRLAAVHCLLESVNLMELRMARSETRSGFCSGGLDISHGGKPKAQRGVH